MQTLYAHLNIPADNRNSLMYGLGPPRMNSVTENLGLPRLPSISNFNTSLFGGLLSRSPSKTPALPF